MTAMMTRRSMALACAALTAGFAAQAQGTLTGAQALRQIHDKRDVVRNLELKTAPKIQIGKDALEFTVKSARKGFVYVLIAGADNKTLTLLFPNKVDSNNQIAAALMSDKRDTSALMVSRACTANCAMRSRY